MLWPDVPVSYDIYWCRECRFGDDLLHNMPTSVISHLCMPQMRWTSLPMEPSLFDITLITAIRRNA